MVYPETVPLSIAVVGPALAFGLRWRYLSLAVRLSTLIVTGEQKVLEQTGIDRDPTRLRGRWATSRWEVEAPVRSGRWVRRRRGISGR